MKIQFVGNEMASDAVQEMISAKLVRTFARFGLTGAFVTLSKEDKAQALTVRLIADNVSVVTAKSSGQNIYDVIDKVIYKARRQYIKAKSKQNEA
ncbi:HPF/RaiA family ribosome-associated protein [Vibrio mediterranei]|uniref:HPF/RaiA family ribosome-associated protein n=1 Tax=Vibrio mediterranei TaxID=689 RepID=UPI0040685DC6